MGQDIGATVTGAIKLLFNDKLILLIAVTFALISTAVNITIIKSINTTGVLSSALSLAINTIVAVIVLYLVQLFFVIMVFNRVYYGSKKDLGNLVNAAMNRYPTVLLLMIALTAAFVIPLLVILALTAVAQFFAILLLPYVVLLIFAIVMLALAMPIAVLDNKGVTASMRQSWNSVKGNWWYVLLCFLLLGIITAIISFVINIPITLQSLSNSLNATASNSTSPAALANNIRVDSSPYAIIATFASSILSFWSVILFPLLYKQLYKQKTAT